MVNKRLRKMLIDLLANTIKNKFDNKLDINRVKKNIKDIYIELYDLTIDYQQKLNDIEKKILSIKKYLKVNKNEKV